MDRTFGYRDGCFGIDSLCADVTESSVNRFTEGKLTHQVLRKILFTFTDIGTTVTDLSIRGSNDIV